MVDRFTEALRSILEDMLGKIDGLTVVERQRIDSLLVETEFGAMSGLVDQEKTVKLGKMLGANVIVMGTIIEIRDDNGWIEQTRTGRLGAGDLFARRHLSVL